MTVEAAAAQTGDLSTQSTYIGTISAEGTASVVAMVSGNVEQVAVAAGDTVTAGDLLCRFDDESARLTLQNAQAAVNSAQETYNSAMANYGGPDLTLLQEQLRLAQDNYDDTQALLAIGAASQAEVDQAYQTLLSAQSGVEAARASMSSAQAGIQSAQVGVASAQYQLSLYNLTAPISGVVEAVNVTENNFTASGTAAFVISNGTNKTVTFYVTDSVRKTLTPRTGGDGELQRPDLFRRGHRDQRRGQRPGGPVPGEGRHRRRPGPARRPVGGADHHLPPGGGGGAGAQRRHVL